MPNLRLLFALPLIGFLALTAILFVGLFNDPSQLPSVLISQPLPAFSAPRLGHDEIVTSADLQGPALLNVWATWCPPCRVEHPFLVELANEGVPIYGLNYKDQPELALRWLTQLGDPYRRVIQDSNGQIGLDLGVYGAPETFLIDANGIIRHRHAGIVDRSVWEQELLPRWRQLDSSGDNS